MRAAHAAYARAGAQVLLTASYQASFAGFAARGADRARAAELFASSVALARSAAREVAEPTGARPAWVAASVGPYGAVRADGGEYRGRYGLSVAELARFHRPRVEAQRGPDSGGGRVVGEARRGLLQHRPGDGHVVALQGDGEVSDLGLEHHPLDRDGPAQHRRRADQRMPGEGQLT